MQSVIAIILLIGMIQVDGQADVAKTLQIDEQQAQYLPLINNQTTECVKIVRCEYRQWVKFLFFASLSLVSLKSWSLVSNKHVT